MKERKRPNQNTIHKLVTKKKKILSERDSRETSRHDVWFEPIIEMKSKTLFLKLNKSTYNCLDIVSFKKNSCYDGNLSSCT